MSARSFVELLYEEAAPEVFEEQLRRAQAAGAGPEDLTRLRTELGTALRVRAQLARHRQREAELSALYETANDLTAIRDVDAVLTAIVRRARQLLNADITYLSLNDPERGDSFIRMTDGSVSATFRRLRLPLGTGLLGLVAQTGAPYFTDDYFADRRFIHRDYIDHAVAEEGIRAIVGVPLLLGGHVLGALLAGNRTVRPFPPGQVELLGSLAAHAAIALENARLFEEKQAAIGELDAANATVRAHSEAVELAASAHDRLADVVLHGGGVDAVAAVLADVLGGCLEVTEPGGHVLARSGVPPQPAVEADGHGHRCRRRAQQRPERGTGVRPAGGRGDPHIPGVGGGGRRRQRPSGHAGARPAARPGRGRPTHPRTRSAGDCPAAAVPALGRGGRGPGTRRAPRRPTLRAEAWTTARPGNLARAGPPPPCRSRAGSCRTGRPCGGRRTPPGRGRGLPAGGVPERARRTVRRRGGARPSRERSDGPRPVRPRPARRPGGHDGHGRRGRTRSRADQIAAAYRTARRCLATMLALGRRGQAGDVESLGFAQLLLGGGIGESVEIDAFLAGTIGPVLDYDQQRGTQLALTVEAWFAAGGSPARAAEHLHVHANTVAQRLDRVAALLGTDWRTPGRALEVQLALRLWRLRSVGL